MMTQDWNLLLLPGGPYLVCTRWRQKRLQELPCVRVLAGGDVFRGPGHQNLSATVTTFRSQINNLVCSFDDIQVVLNDDNGIALVAGIMQHGQKLFDVVKMETRGGFIKDIQCFSRVSLGKLA